MKGFTLRHVCHFGFLCHLVFFSFMSLTTAVSFDLTELRNKVAKIKVNPRGNLWATGHFMGKKSVMDAPLLPPAEGQVGDGVPEEQNALMELLHQFLRLDMQEQLQAENRKNQGADVLMKILESYIQSRK